MKKRIFRNRKTRYASISTVLTVLVIAVVILANTVFGSLANRYEWVTSMNAKANYDVTTVCYNLLDSAFANADADKREEPVQLIFCDTEEVWTSDETQNYLYHTAMSIADRYERVTISFFDIRIHPGSVRQYAVNPLTGEEMPIRYDDVIVVCGDYYHVYNLRDFFSFTDAARTNVWAYNGERKLAAGILRALNRKPQTVCLTSNHGELFYDDELAYLLEDAGYHVVSNFNLADDEIPEACTLIVTYNPNSDLDFSDGIKENEKLDRFLSKTGNNYLVFLSNGSPRLTNLETYLRQWGVEATYYNDSTTGKSYRYTVQDSSNSLTSDGYTIYGALSERANSAALFEGVDKSVVFQNATALTHASDFEALADGSYQKDKRTVYSVYEASETASLWANGSVRGGNSALLMTLTEQKNEDGGVSRVGVFASCSVVSREFAQSAVFENPDVMFRLFDVMGQEYTPEGIKIKPFGTMQISTITTAQMLRWTICLAVIPASLVAVAGIVVMIRRRRA